MTTSFSALGNWDGKAHEREGYKKEYTTFLLPSAQVTDPTPKQEEEDDAISMDMSISEPTTPLFPPTDDEDAEVVELQLELPPETRRSPSIPSPNLENSIPTSRSRPTKIPSQIRRSSSNSQSAEHTVPERSPLLEALDRASPSVSVGLVNVQSLIPRSRSIETKMTRLRLPQDQSYRSLQNGHMERELSPELLPPPKTPTLPPVEVIDVDTISSSPLSSPPRSVGSLFTPSPVLQPASLPSPPPPPQPPLKRKKKLYVDVPPFPPGLSKTDFLPLQRHHQRQRRARITREKFSLGDVMSRVFNQNAESGTIERGKSVTSTASTSKRVPVKSQKLRESEAESISVPAKRKKRMKPNTVAKKPKVSSPVVVDRPLLFDLERGFAPLPLSVVKRNTRHVVDPLRTRNRLPPSLAEAFFGQPSDHRQGCIGCFRDLDKEEEQEYYSYRVERDTEEVGRRPSLKPEIVLVRRPLPKVVDPPLPRRPLQTGVVRAKKISSDDYVSPTPSPSRSTTPYTSTSTLRSPLQNGFLVQTPPPPLSPLFTENGSPTSRTEPTTPTASTSNGRPKAAVFYKGGKATLSPPRRKPAVPRVRMRSQSQSQSQTSSQSLFGCSFQDEPSPPLFSPPACFPPLPLDMSEKARGKQKAVEFVGDLAHPPFVPPVIVNGTVNPSELMGPRFSPPPSLVHDSDSDDDVPLMSYRKAASPPPSRKKRFRKQKIREDMVPWGDGSDSDYVEETPVPKKPRKTTQRKRTASLPPPLPPAAVTSDSETSSSGSDSDSDSGSDSSSSSTPTPSPEPEPSDKVGPPRTRKLDWPTGNIECFCHQCRHKSTRVFMSCFNCPKKYCVKCCFTWYRTQIRFAPNETFECPCCCDMCMCTTCTRRRGDVYAPKKYTGPIPTFPSDSHHKHKHKKKKKKRSKEVEIAEVTGQVKFWATCYSTSGGEKMGDLFVGDVPGAVVLERTERRTFVGAPRVKKEGKVMVSDVHERVREGKAWYIGTKKPPERSAVETENDADGEYDNEEDMPIDESTLSPVAVVSPEQCPPPAEFGGLVGLGLVPNASLAPVNPGTALGVSDISKVAHVVMPTPGPVEPAPHHLKGSAVVREDLVRSPATSADLDTGHSSDVHMDDLIHGTNNVVVDTDMADARIQEIVVVDDGPSENSGIMNSSQMPPIPDIQIPDRAGPLAFLDGYASSGDEGE